ncbi:MAG: urease accessory protein UreE [Nitrososphaeraceae archaeon]
MLTIDHVVGNIYNEDKLGATYRDFVSKQQDETFLITRTESQRHRMRKVSNKGTDIALNFHSGNQHLRHGDVLLLNDNQIVVVEIEPENVLQVEILKQTLTDSPESLIQIPVQIGHTIGNLHRPIRLDGPRIYFPIQAESEIEMFRKLFHPFHHHIDIQSKKIVFEPNETMNVHEH